MASFRHYSTVNSSILRECSVLLHCECFCCQTEREERFVSLEGQRVQVGRIYSLLAVEIASQSESVSLCEETGVSFNRVAQFHHQVRNKPEFNVNYLN